MEMTQHTREEAAAREWYITPNSGSGGSKLQLCMNADTMLQQSSPSPRSWMPQLLSRAVLAGFVSPCVVHGANQEDISLHSMSLDRSRTADLYALVGERVKCTLWASQPRAASLTIVSEPVITKYIEELESSLKLTRSQIAQALGVERATFYQWLRGSQPRPKTG